MKRATHSEGKVGGPCHHIKRDGFWCQAKATKVVGRYAYCSRHAKAAMTYGPVER